MTPDSDLQKALFETTCALVIDGELQEPFYSYCIEINENRELKVGWMKAKL